MSLDVTFFVRCQDKREKDSLRSDAFDRIWRHSRTWRDLRPISIWLDEQRNTFTAFKRALMNRVIHRIMYSVRFVSYVRLESYKSHLQIRSIRHESKRGLERRTMSFFKVIHGKNDEDCVSYPKLNQPDNRSSLVKHNAKSNNTQIIKYDCHVPFKRKMSIDIDGEYAQDA